MLDIGLCLALHVVGTARIVSRIIFPEKKIKIKLVLMAISALSKLQDSAKIPPVRYTNLNGIVHITLNLTGLTLVFLYNY